MLVHGSLDRADSFRRVVRRLDDVTSVTYDRRGYQRSRRAGPPADVRGHVGDLVGLLEPLKEEAPAAPIAVVGHSLGGLIALGTSVERPDLVSAVGVYEPPLPWLGFRRTGGRRATDADPGLEAERFFRRMMGDRSWDRLPGREQASRRDDGPAMVAEFRALDEAPFELTAISVPVVLGHGGAESARHHVEGTRWLSQRLRGAALVEMPSAGHGAHLSHPTQFAHLVREVMRRGTSDQEAAG